MKKLQFPLNVNVKSDSSGYTTQTIAGLRASSTSSAETAVAGLVGKIAAQQGVRPEQLAHREIDAKGLGPGKSIWRIERRGA